MRLLLQNGAEWIYETDDDNGGDLSSFWLSSRPVDALTPADTPPLFNPYPHFGQSTMWPRGYPLDRLGSPLDRAYRLCRLDCPAVQQGLSDGDPDVDALFRLTRQPAAPLRLRFDPAAPSVGLRVGTMAPYNSQNTLHAALGFFALLLPVTVSDRATDIYRAYWAQRLLWLVGGNVVFHPPTVEHRRNAHSALLDSVQEQQMYRDAGRLTASLAAWRCQRLFLFDCLVDLTRHLVQEGFLQQRDIDVVAAWVSDLAGVGYAPPVMATPRRCAASAPAVEFRPNEQLTSFAHLARLTRTEADGAYRRMLGARLAQVCPGGTPHLPHRPVSDILLVVTVGPDAAATLPLAQLAFRSRFAHVLYCGTAGVALHDTLADYSATYVRLPTADGVACVAAAIRINYSVAGVLHTSHRVAVDPAALPTNATADVWLTQPAATATLCRRRGAVCQRVGPSVLSRLRAVKTAVDGAAACMESLARAAESRRPPEVLYQPDSPFYVPRHLAPQLQRLHDAFSGHQRTARHTGAAVLLLECLHRGRVRWLLDQQGTTTDQQGATDQQPLALAEVLTNSTVKKHFCQRLTI